MRVARRREGETRGKGKAGGAKKASHRFVRIRGAYVRQARGKAHGRVARRREGESRGKGKAGGAKKASHRFVRIRGGKEFLLLENSKNKTKVEARRRRHIVSFEEERNGRVARRKEGESRGKEKAGGAKKGSHRVVRIPKNAGRVARRRGKETRGKGKSGGAKKASHRFVRGGKEFLRRRKEGVASFRSNS